MCFSMCFGWFCFPVGFLWNETPSLRPGSASSPRESPKCLPPSWSTCLFCHLVPPCRSRESPDLSSGDPCHQSCYPLVWWCSAGAGAHRGCHQMKYKTVYVGAAVVDSFALFQALCVLYRDGFPPPRDYVWKNPYTYIPLPQLRDQPFVSKVTTDLLVLHQGYSLNYLRNPAKPQLYHPFPNAQDQWHYVGQAGSQRGTGTNMALHSYNCEGCQLYTLGPTQFVFVLLSSITLSPDTYGLTARFYFQSLFKHCLCFRHEFFPLHLGKCMSQALSSPLICFRISLSTSYPLILVHVSCST